MSRGINKVTLVARLGSDPESKTLSNGNVITNVTVATSEGWKDKNTGEQQERVEWHRVVMFGKLAEIAAKYLTKGSQAYFEGKLQTRKWQDADGNDRYSTEIVANEMQMLGGKVVEAVSANKSEPSNYGKQTAKQTTPQPEGFDPEDFEDIPF